jgi:hypothetical protein
LQQKVTRPPLGSEEARKETLAKTRDKINSCLLSFRNEKSEVLENLLSNEEEQKKKETTRASLMMLEKSGYAGIQVTPSDLKVIGMVNTSVAGTSSELDVTGNNPFETIPTNELLNSSNIAEIAAQSSDCSEGGLVSNDVCNTYTAPDTKLLGSIERDSMCSSLERETGLRDSSKQTERAPHSVYRHSGFTSESSSLRQLASNEVQTSSSHPCSQFRSSLSTSNPGDSSNQSEHGTNIGSSYEHPFSSSRSDPKRTLKNLKQRIIQQFLKMGKNNLKDLINNPRSRKFEFAMNHLMKEHRLLLTRELRTLAQSRIRGQDVENQEQSEQICETDTLLDTDAAIDLSHLPQEVIEQLGNFLQLDVLDNAESIDFQPITVEDESSVHDLQNIQALQVALLSEENVKREVTGSEEKPVIGTEVMRNAVEESITEKDLMEGQHGQTSDSQQNLSMMDAGTGQAEETLRGTMEDEQQVISEEGTVEKPRKVSSGWPNYVPLGKGFMNRSGEFGNLFYEFPDTLGVRSTECEAVGGQNNNVTDFLCTKQTDGGVAKYPQLETDQKCPRTLDKVVSPDSASEANEAHARPADEMGGCSSSLETNVMPNEILNTEVGDSSSRSLNNSSTEKSVLERLTTDCLTNTDTGVRSCNEDNWIDTSRKEGCDSSHHTSNDSGTNFHASDVETVIQAKEMLKDSADVGPPECSVVTDGHVKGSANSGGLLVDNGEPLGGAAVADKPIEDSSEHTGALFEDSNVNNVNTVFTRINEEMNISTNDTGPRKTEIKCGDFEEWNSAIFELPKEGSVSKEDSCVAKNLVESSERMDSHYSFEGKHVENMQPNFNSDTTDENSYSQLDTNEGNSNNVKDTTGNMKADQEFITSENQNNVAAVSDPQSESMDMSFVLTGNDTKNVNADEGIAANGNSGQSASAEHNVNSEESKDDVSDEIDISASKAVQAENIGVDDLYGDLNDFPVAKDVTNSAEGKTQIVSSGENYVVDMITRPVSEETVEVDGSGLSILKSAIPHEDSSRGNDSLTAEAGAQFELSSNGTAGSCEIHDEVMEVYDCNVVKIETCDSTAEDRTSVFEEQILHEVNVGKFFCCDMFTLTYWRTIVTNLNLLFC